MHAPGPVISDTIQLADEGFLEIFLPRELKLVQQHVQTRNEASDDSPRNQFLGLYLLRLQSDDSIEFEVDPKVVRHLRRLITSAIRFTDIPGQLSSSEFLVVAREVELDRAFLIAQRLLALTSRSRVLEASGHQVRVGYIIYPLSIEPDLSPTEWPALLELARSMAHRAQDKDNHSGYGLIRGPEMGSPTIPEIDIISLATTDLSSLTRAELLNIRPINITGE